MPIRKFQNTKEILGSKFERKNRFRGKTRNLEIETFKMKIK